MLSWRVAARLLSTCSREFFVLGIETSCDDTGVSVVSSERRILSDERESQLQTHLETGGIIPNVAQELHQQHIENVTKRALDKSGMSIADVRCIAVTQGPGLAGSLKVGLNHALTLAREASKPVIPVHHMEAHALTIRLLTSSVQFPFLVLLVSGGHCILAVCEGFGRFHRLGEALDDSPGEAFDKVSRMLRLHLHPLGRGLSGGAAIEAVAKLGDATLHPLNEIMAHGMDCNFSFAGIKASVKRIVNKMDSASDSQDTVSSPVPGCENIASSFQNTAFMHLLIRTERAIFYCKDRWPNISQLVVSGGVASNQHLKAGLESVVSRHGYSLYTPPPSLCTDNGAMIAWTGIEHINAGCPYHDCSDDLRYNFRWKLGEDISELVGSQRIKVKRRRIID